MIGTLQGGISRNMVGVLESVPGLSMYNLTGRMGDFQSSYVGSSPATCRQGPCVKVRVLVHEKDEEAEQGEAAVC